MNTMPDPVMTEYARPNFLNESFTQEMINDSEKMKGYSCQEIFRVLTGKEHRGWPINMQYLSDRENMLLCDLPRFLHYTWSAPVIYLTPQLQELLNIGIMGKFQSVMTTVVKEAPDIPLSYARLPFENGMYVHLEPRLFQFKKDGTYETSLVGFYIFGSAGKPGPDMNMSGKPCIRKFDFAWMHETHFPNFENYVFPMWSTLEIENQEITYANYCEKIISDYEVNFTGDTSAPEQWKYFYLKQNLIMTGVALKILLYCNSRQFRHEIMSDRTRLLKSAEKKKSKKRNIFLSRAKQKWDYILIGPQTDLKINKEGDKARVVKPHYRRGHFRLQPYGPNLSRKRLIFIEPTIVNEESDNDTTGPGSYKLN